MRRSPVCPEKGCTQAGNATVGPLFLPNPPRGPPLTCQFGKSACKGWQAHLCCCVDNCSKLAFGINEVSLKARGVSQGLSGLISNALPLALGSRLGLADNRCCLFFLNAHDLVRIVSHRCSISRRQHGLIIVRETCSCTDSTASTMRPDSGSAIQNRYEDFEIDLIEDFGIGEAGGIRVLLPGQRTAVTPPCSGTRRRYSAGGARPAPVGVDFSNNQRRSWPRLISEDGGAADAGAGLQEVAPPVGAGRRRIPRATVPCCMPKADRTAAVTCFILLADLREWREPFGRQTRPRLARIRAAADAEPPTSANTTWPSPEGIDMVEVARNEAFQQVERLVVAEFVEPLPDGIGARKSECRWTTPRCGASSARGGGTGRENGALHRGR